MKIKNVFAQKDGYVLLSAMIGSLLVGGLLVAGLVTTSRNLTAQKNIVTRAKTFYSADGVVSMTVQDLIDGNFSKYLLMQGLDSAVAIGSPTFSYTNSHTGQYSDQIAAKGNSLENKSSDNFLLAFTQITGPCDLKVKVKQISNPQTNQRIGLMIRNGKAADAQYAFVGLTDSKVQYQSRKVASDNAKIFGSKNAIAPCWLRLRRLGNTFSAYISADGKDWGSPIYGQTIAMQNTVFAGIAMSSGNGSAITADFDSLECGAGKGKYAVGPGDTVSYSIDQSRDGGYDLLVNARKYDSDGKLTYSMPLKQHFALNVTSPVRPSEGYLHYIIYDYHCDGTNPNFQNCNIEAVKMGVTQKKLGTNGKPLLQRDQSVSSDCRVPRWEANWTGPKGWTDGTNDPERSCDRISYEKLGCINRLNEWFMVSGNNGPDTTYHMVQDSTNKSKWRWKKTDGTELTYDAGPKAWKSNPYFSNDIMANMIVYDSVKLTTLTVMVNNMPFPGGKATAYGFEPLSINPLKNRGWYGEKPHLNYQVDHACSPGPSRCTRKGHFGSEKTPSSDNNAWAMEIHTFFTYHAGENAFYVPEMSSSYCWLFINDSLVSDLGNVEVKKMGEYPDTVWFDSIAPTLNMFNGGVYSLAWFMAVLGGGGGDVEFQFFSDLDFFSNSTSHSTWRRDYGLLD